MRVAYIRVSTNSDDQANSFENQEAHFKGMGILKIYSDQGISGTSLKNRNGFISMLKDCGLSVKEVKSGSHKKLIVMDSNRESIIDTIYCKSITRFSRNTAEGIDIVKTLSNKGIRILFEQEGIDTGNPTSDLMLNILLTMAQNESQELSKRIRWGNLETAKRGVNRSYNAYGYTYNKVYKQIYINDEEAKVVRRMFELRLENKGCRMIANILKEEGYISRSGKPFSQSTILGILKNPIYCGYITRNRYDIQTLKPSGKYHEKSEEEWIQHYDPSLAIISVEDFNAVKKLISESASGDKGINRGHTELAGKIKCGNCGASYTRNCNGKYVWYNCSTKKKHGKAMCNNINVTQHKVDRMINRFLNDGLYKHYERMTKVIDRLADRYIAQLNNSLNNADEKLISSLETERDVINNKLQKLLELYLDGIMSKDILDKKKCELEQKLSEVNNEINKLNAPSDIVRAKIDTINKIRDIAHKEYAQIPKNISREQLLDDYIDSITVTKNGVLIVRTNIVSYLQKIHGVCNATLQCEMTYSNAIEWLNHHILNNKKE